MKQNWLAILSLFMCLILLIIMFNQAKQLKSLEQELDSRIDALHDSLDQEVQKLSSNVRRELEEANSVIAEFAIAPSGLDTVSDSLLAEVSLELKQWNGDTTVEVLCVTGEDMVRIPLTSAEAGKYSGQVRIPLKTGAGFTLEAYINSNGATQVEDLGSWGDISMLLPLQHNGGGWSGPNYLNGAVKTQFHVSIGSLNDREVQLFEPRFQIYKNGVLADTIAAVIDPEAYSYNGICYTTDTQGNFYSLECEPEDVIEFRFLCRDAFGLCYDFLFLKWCADENIPDTMTGENLILSWEE